jgi:tetratricopeptide (TPR) repeat protein
MRFTKGAILCIGLACILGGCQKKIDKKDMFASIGGKVFSQKDYSNFQSMQQEYPTQMGRLFPGPNRPAATAFVEIEAIAQKAGGSVERAVVSAPDWKWKKLFYEGQTFLRKNLNVSLGFTDQELQAYYDGHRDDFKVVIKIPVAVDSSKIKTTADSTHVTDSTATAQPQMRDSVEYPTLDAVRSQIAQTLFFQKYPIPTEYFKTEGDTTSATAQIKLDTAMIKQRYFSAVRADLPQFFMKKFYQEKFGKPFPDSLNEWYGEGKIITPADYNVILHWLPEDRRDDYSNPQGTGFLAGWLLKWLIFSEKLAANGGASSPDLTQSIYWAKRFEIANHYIEKTLVPTIEKQITLDTMMCIYAYWDGESEPGVMPDSSQLTRALRERANAKTVNALDSIIFTIRQEKGVAFLQNDWKDGKDKDPKALMASADSLLNAGESSKAEDIYRTIIQEKAFTPEGKQALLEMAKLNTESEKYRQAINYYRDYLILGDSISKRCNTFFMIGFIFDEYLDDAKHAAVNYRWILKNEPRCELSDDAEFMYLHLEEPMIGVEDLQAEARRQGRRVEESTVPGADSVSVVDTVAVK